MTYKIKQCAKVGDPALARNSVTSSTVCTEQW